MLALGKYSAAGVVGKLGLPFPPRGLCPALEYFPPDFNVAGPMSSLGPSSSDSSTLERLP